MNIKLYFSVVFSFLFINIFNSCNPEIDLIEKSGGEVCNLILDVPYPGFFDEVGTRAASTTWQDGDQLFIWFGITEYSTENYYNYTTYYGTATYSKGGWTFTSNLELSAIPSGQCSVYYFKGENVNVNNEEEKITFDPNTCIYGTKSALYSYNNGDLVVSATLAPMVSRIRFEGEVGSKIVVSADLFQYSSYSISFDDLRISDVKETTLTVNPNGYTDYIYVAALTDFITEFDNVELSLYLDHNKYTKSYDKSIFVSGLSGMIQIPTESIYNGWKKEELPDAILVDGYKFNSVINTLANKSGEAIKKVVVKCNSQVTTETLVSRNSSPNPIYADISNGVITLYTSGESINVDNAGFMFDKLKYLEEIDMSKFDFQNLSSTCCMFRDCNSLKSIDLSKINTSIVTDMSSMFSGCLALTSLDLSHFDTSNVTDMGDMFLNCIKLTSLDVSHFDTSNVTDMSIMFSGCSSISTLDLSHFDTSNVTNMRYLFIDCEKLTSLVLSNFDTSKVTDMEGMFAYNYNLESLVLSHKFIISDRTNISVMCQNLAQPPVRPVGYSRKCTITCTQDTKSKLLSSNTNLNSSYITWNIL